VASLGLATDDPVEVDIVVGAVTAAAEWQLE
jgi:hypothetical protein